jgi:hypothetical protein
VTGVQTCALPISRDVDTDLFTREGVLDEDDLAIGAMGHALGFQVQGLDFQPLGHVSGRRRA